MKNIFSINTLKPATNAGYHSVNYRKNVINTMAGNACKYRGFTNKIMCINNLFFHKRRISKLRLVCIFANRFETSFSQPNHQNSKCRNLLVLKAFNVFERLSFFPNVNNSIVFA